ncbi:hypothetical protein JTE90_023772 [Oedothorax gibbosus]|uniref:CCHC-type domain-containing protein n=1 Tax=Oedothorax gibbosus TaxID=931172 RepID=A0AAV6UT24_9ARAC|nr:hypothetical protein JTE90_023772 [Oedothorax gibbosus]
MTHEEKVEVLKNKKCCYSCLKIGHRAKACRSKIQCICCGKKHYIIMCPDFKPTKNKHQDKAVEPEVLDQAKICGPIPHIKDQLDLSELRQKGITITDCSQEIRPIEILIRADMAGKLYTGNIVPLKSGITAMETYLGWVIMGKQANVYSKKSIDAVTSSLLSQNFNIENLWNLEALGTQDPYEPQNKIELENAVRENLIRSMTVEDGRYQDMQTVGVPDLDHLDEVDVTRRFRYQQKLREELRKRFRSEYLGQLTLAKSNTKSILRINGK